MEFWKHLAFVYLSLGFPGSSAGKDSFYKAGDPSLTPGLGGGHGTHSSILVCRIPQDRGAWWATVHGVTKSQT